MASAREQEILDYLRDRERVLVTSPEIAESLDVDRRTVRYHTHKKEQPMMGDSVGGVTIGRAEGLYLLEDDPFVTPPASELPDDDEGDETAEDDGRAEAGARTAEHHSPLNGLRARVSTAAIGFVVVQMFASQLPIELPVWALLPAALVGVALIAWGMAPLIRRTETAADGEVSAGA